ncbi:MAG: hypothetical protein K0S12_2004 [Bacteroidetes bacterium]|nr:hypothetical protein [Bacteroidota bacterium]
MKTRIVITATALFFCSMLMSSCEKKQHPPKKECHKHQPAPAETTSETETETETPGT